jgi:hypothetical protein
MTTTTIARRLAGLGSRLAAMRRDPGLRLGDAIGAAAGEIEACCTAMAALPRRDVVPLRPRLVALLGELDELRRLVAADRDEAETRLDGLARRRAAHAAYARRGR